MTLEEIDQLLADWKLKIDLVSQNLIDLHNLPTYQRLAGSSGFPKAKLTGVTQTRVSSALSAMNDLFGYFDLIVNTVHKANQLRSSISRLLLSQQKLQEIEKILITPSIELSVVQTPLAERGLLSAPETTHSIAPQELLHLMTNAFDDAKEVVLAVDSAWARLEPMLIQAQAEIEKLQALAIALGVESLKELSAVSHKINLLRDCVESDPLGVTDDFTSDIQPQITQVKTTLEQLAKQQQFLRDGFTRAHQLRSQLIKLHHQALEAYTESTLKVVDHSGLQIPLEDKHIEALVSWLSRLETKFAEGLVNPVCVGLENWIAKVKEYIAATEKVYAANRAPLEMRSELRGRLDALKAKAIARGLVEDTVLTELALHAQQLLYSRPTPLDEAARFVSQYEKCLNSGLLGR
ncbi:hypothetical protein F7734_40200 [Scytonema sp. UIC 10036]|uniref:hypothetical protein n=1 Tax=Scytonema sp. UIC 10036 TaxID=2304196 RepID=UPI0012DAD2F2|nr:hypothetical protein [Scytonema sp. UIC 10036]MUG98203.1 hypothetical protein [Scytonema sp. UIC 10036]